MRIVWGQHDEPDSCAGCDPRNDLDLATRLMLHRTRSIANLTGGKPRASQ